MPKMKWQDIKILDAYLLAVSGLKNVKIAEALGISLASFKLWAKKKPAFKTAVCRGRKIYKNDRKGGISFKSYVYNQLDPKIKKLWDEIDECDDGETTDIKRVEALLKKGGKRARQHIFVYAWTESHFNMSYALKKANISRTLFKNWLESEPEFAELCDEIQWHKKNFYEAGLNTLVAEKNPMVTVFANKTMNADRGFGERMKIEMDATVKANMQAHIPISKLDLTPKIKKKVLEALRKYKKEQSI